MSNNIYDILGKIGSLMESSNPTTEISESAQPTTTSPLKEAIAAMESKFETFKEGKPDFLDLDKDGDKKEPMKKASKQAKDEQIDESDEDWGSMSKREFKRRELETELAGEEHMNGYGIFIGGKFWKAVKSKNHAESIVRTLKAKGKDASMLYGAFFESVQESELGEETYKFRGYASNSPYDDKSNAEEFEVKAKSTKHANDKAIKKMHTKFPDHTHHGVKLISEGDDVMAYTGPSEFETNQYSAKELETDVRFWEKNGMEYEEICDAVMAMVDDGAVSLKDARAVLTNIHKKSNLSERAKSKAQQKFMGMVHAAQKGEKPASKEVAKAAKSISKKEATKFAKTKHKGLPQHVDETTGVTDYNPASQGGTRKELLAKYHKTQNPKDAEAARRAGATQKELQDGKTQVTESRHRMMEAHSTFDHILQRFPAEVKSFERTGELDNDLYESLYDFYFNSGEMPYGVAKARSGDPMAWVAERLERDLGIGVPEMTDHFDELDEIAQLAGLNMADEDAMSLVQPDSSSPLTHTEEIMDEEEMDEGNKFSGALSAAKASGETEFEVDGKKYTVKEDVSLNVSANGEEDVVNLIRKLSGMPVVAVAASHADPEEGELCDQCSQVGVEEPVEEERDIEYVNTPDEKVAPLSAAYPSGSDLHKAKKSYSNKPYRGDNPMAESVEEKTLWKKYSDMLQGLIK